MLVPLLALLVGVSPLANAQGGHANASPCVTSTEVCSSGGDDTFTVVAVEGPPAVTSPVVGPVGTPSGAVTRAEYAPACSGNTRLDTSITCVNAGVACPQPGDISYWVWIATFDRATGRQLTPWVQQQDPLAVCKGPTDPGVPKGPAIAGLLARDFQRLVLLKGTVTAHPAGTTLVNLDTRFTTDAADYDLPTLTLLGSRVQVRAHTERYAWTFGDGTTADVADPRTTHRYLRPGRVGVTVRITWSGTYTVDGGPQLTVQGTAVTTGPATALRVAEAHAERVTR